MLFYDVIDSKALVMMRNLIHALLIIGSRLDARTTLSHTVIAPSAKLVQIDIDPDEIGSTYPVQVGMAADANENQALYPRGAAALGASLPMALGAQQAARFATVVCCTSFPPLFRHCVGGGSPATFTQEEVTTRILRHLKLASVPPPIAPDRRRLKPLATTRNFRRFLRAEVCDYRVCLEEAGFVMSCSTVLNRS